MSELTPAQLKAQKKAAKAAKRAASKEASGVAPTRDPREAKKEQQQAAAKEGGSSSNSGGNNSNNTQGGSNQSSASASSKEDRTRASRPALFGHLEKAGKVTAADAGKDVHPEVITLALRYSSYKIVGSSDRARTLLQAFQRVIADYETPEGTTLSRNLTTHLGHQIDFVISARPLSVSMGNAIRWLKQEISVVSIDMSDQAAKDMLVEKIDEYIKEKIDVSGSVIVESAVNDIADGDTVLTFAHSEVVENTFIAAHQAGKRFKVIVVDSRPLHEGRKLARDLSARGIECIYILVSALAHVLDDVSRVFLGAHAMLSNGALLSRVGSALIATAAKRKNIPVIVLCESMKFSDRVQLDSVTLNELAFPEMLANTYICDKKQLPEDPSKTSLKYLNLCYDLTPAANLTKIITELGHLPPSAVPVIMREYKSAYTM
ncbi:putative translation initiation factor eIF-2B subunit delta [Yarrowia sp. C11]|nr:putative translation initiation factor eIF-2B subunit delta [Yarrowia sp. C11]